MQKLARVLEISEGIYTLRLLNNSQPNTRAPLDQISMTKESIESNIRNRLSKTQPFSDRLLKGFTFFLSLSTHTEDGKGINFVTVDIKDPWIVDRSFLVQQIELHGGQVANTPERNPMNILIANRPLRTKRYLTGLACGILIVSITWLKKCILESKLFDCEQFRLSNGYSLALSHWVSIKMERTPIFSRVKVYVVDGDSTSRNWTEILQAAGAVISHSRSESDYILFEERPSENKDWNGAVAVTTEWVIQCLIHQTIIPTIDNAHFTTWRK